MTFNWKECSSLRPDPPRVQFTCIIISVPEAKLHCFAVKACRSYNLVPSSAVYIHLVSLTSKILSSTCIIVTVLKYCCYEIPTSCSACALSNAPCRGHFAGTKFGALPVGFTGHLATRILVQLA